MKRSEASLMQLKKKELVELILQEQVEGNPLGQRTKQELIDIILRKDDVEIRLKESLKDKEDEISQLNGRIDGYEVDINGYQQTLDENATVIANLDEKIRNSRKMIKRWRTAFIILAAVAIVIIAIVAIVA